LVASSTIGVVTAAVAMIYFVFMVYFDNIRHQHLPPFRQQAWAFMHFPVHLAMVLFMEGATQFVIWWKVLEIENGLSNTLIDAFNQVGVTINKTQDFVNLLEDKINDFVTLFPPTYTTSLTALNDVIGNLSTFPDSYWQINFTDDDPRLLPLISNVTFLWSTLDNILLNKFKIDLTEDVEKSVPSNTSISDLQNQLSAESWQRFNLVVSALADAVFCESVKSTECSRRFSSNILSCRPALSSSSLTCCTSSRERRGGGRGTSSACSSRLFWVSACV
jgi:hypothetical protein